ncbi:protein of unknown function DUF4216 [Dillenia turbinata]|uniref:DUF4216 domain-containing protein n=1 Tax=Dillenia turbinata TaxID=194707 RepID=A0AAN8UXV1_9MAGN
MGMGKEDKTSHNEKRIEYSLYQKSTRNELDYSRWIYHGEASEDDLDDDNVAYNVEHKENDDNDLDMIKEYENLSKCPNEKYNEPCYKSNSSKVSRKVLRYFSLTPKLRRLLKHTELSDSELVKIHIFVLNSCDEIEDYINEHKLKLEAESSANIEQRHDIEFPLWFQQCVLKSSFPCNGEIQSLAFGPDSRVRRYSGCMINGYRFHTKDRENERKTQNSGVVVKGEHWNNTIDFYGVLIDIFKVEYFIGRNKVLIFKCEWFNLGDARGIQLDKESRITSINVSRNWYSDQPYVLVQQVQQVFYIEDIKLGKNGYVVEKANPCNSYDILQAQYQELVDEARFSVDDSTMTKSAVNKQLNTQYRTHHYKLHKYFQTFQSKEEALRHPPADVPEEDWNWLCEYLTSDTFKVAEEKRRTEGIEASPIDLYQYGHFSRKTGTWGSEKAKENFVGYKGHVSTSKQIEYDVQRYKQKADEVEKKACEAEKKENEAEKKACDAEKKLDELAKKADEA